jgi:hypothetical protein
MPELMAGGSQRTVKFTKVYRVTSVIDRWPHRGARWNGVKVTWLTYRDQPIAPYRVLLAGDYDDPYAQSLADELFTEEEATALARYLREAHGQDVTVTEVRLPMPTRSPEGDGFIGVSAIPCGGDTDQYMLYREPGYDLPFEVSGYYSIDYGEQHLAQVRCRHACDGTEHWIDAPPPAQPAPVPAANPDDCPF